MTGEYSQLRVGLMGVGLNAYWAQFAGLEARLTGYLKVVEGRISSNTRHIVNLGLVDTSQKATEAGHRCRRDDIDILLVYVTTYTLSALLLPVIRRIDIPVVFLNLQPEAAIDYAVFNRIGDVHSMTGEWLAFCNSCPMPEIANVLKRLDIAFHQVTGTLQDDCGCWPELFEWLCAAAVAKKLCHSRMGLMGHYYSGMLDIATDLTQVSGRFGIHLEILEVESLSALRREVASDDVARKVEDFERFFAVDGTCSGEELEEAAKTAVALERLVADQELDLIAYYYRGCGIDENVTTMSSIILGASMLTGNGIPVAGEYDIKNAIAMKILDSLGAGGSFTEYYGIDFAADVLLMGHDGPGHIGIAEDKIRVRSLGVYHGKVGEGLSVEMSVRCGPVTLLSVVEDRVRGFCLLVAEGESVAGEILKIGNTNSRYRFSLGAQGFVGAWNKEGPAHHCAIGIGHIGSQLSKVAKVLDLGFTQIC